MARLERAVLGGLIFVGISVAILSVISFFAPKERMEIVFVWFMLVPKLLISAPFFVATVAPARGRSMMVGALIGLTIGVFLIVMHFDERPFIYSAIPACVVAGSIAGAYLRGMRSSAAQPLRSSRPRRP